ncbi:MAG: IS630 transposase-related protein [Acidimicrobiales bacterium]
MAYGYSIDLRERVLQALDGGMSKMTAHRTFGVSRSTLDHWLALRAQTGSLAPRAPRHRRARQLEGAAFEEFAARQAHASLPEMAQAWQQETGVLLSTMSFSKALARLGWTRKKRDGATKKELALSGARRSVASGVRRVRRS